MNGIALRRGSGVRNLNWHVDRPLLVSLGGFWADVNRFQCVIGYSQGATNGRVELGCVLPADRNGHRSVGVVH